MSTNYGPVRNPEAKIVEEGGRVKIILWGCRTQYANVMQPRAATAAAPGKSAKPAQYDCEFLLPKSAIGAEAAVAKIRELGAKRFPGKKWHSALVQDGDRVIADLEASGVDVSGNKGLRRGHWIFKANSGVDKKPNVGGNIYSGCYAGASINVAPYENESIGIKGYLNAVQFQGDGEALSGGSVNLNDEFGMATPQSSVVPDAGDDFIAEMAQYAAPNKPVDTANDDLPF